MSLLIRKEVIDMADSKVEYPAPDCLAPAAIEAKTEAAGVTKANLPVAKAFLLAMFAGAFIAFGGLFFTVFLSDSTLGWGAQRVVGGLCFCLGLVLVLVCGAELFTGNSLMVCALKSKITGERQPPIFKSGHKKSPSLFVERLTPPLVINHH